MPGTQSRKLNCTFREHKFAVLEAGSRKLSPTFLGTGPVFKKFQNKLFGFGLLLLCMQTPRAFM